MPREPAVHYNPDDERRYKDRTRCGEALSRVSHSTNPDHATCGNCKRCIRADRGLGA